MDAEVGEELTYAYSNVRNSKRKGSSKDRVKSDEIRGTAEESGGRDNDAERLKNKGKVRQMKLYETSEDERKEQNNRKKN